MKRYDCEATHQDYEPMIERPEGKWITWEDHKTAIRDAIDGLRITQRELTYLVDCDITHLECGIDE